MLGRFAQPEVVMQYKRGEISYEEIKVEVMKLYFLVRGQVNALLSDGTITEKQVQTFYAVCLDFHRTAFPYAIKNFPIKDEFLKHARFLSFYDQK